MTDDNEKTLEVLSDLANGLEAVAVKLKHDIADIATPKENQSKKETPAVVEQTFLCLKFEPQEGQKIGPYDVAYEPQNLPENWNHAMDILKANRSVIEKRYHGPGYKFSYWLFGEHKIYRQALKQPSV